MVACDIAEHRGLGHLEGQVARVDARVAHVGDDLVDEARVLELERRQVDADRPSDSTGPAGGATPRPAGGRLQDGPAEREDRAVLLGQADEVGRVDDAAGRVAPADERLDADDPAGGQLDDRLVGDGEVAAADAPAEVGCSARAARRSSGASSGRRPRRGACRPPWPGTSRRRHRAGPRRRARVAADGADADAAADEDVRAPRPGTAARGRR